MRTYLLLQRSKRLREISISKYGLGKEMRQVAHGQVWFNLSDRSRVLDLMRDQSSCMRASYQAKQRGLRGNEITKIVKPNYMSQLNQRYIKDAQSLAEKIRQQHALFGGKKAWRRLQTGALSKQDWVARRNNQLYSRGDKSSPYGNNNIRIIGDELWINDPAQRGLWIRGKFHLPKKWDINFDCYEIRIIHRDGKFEVKISYEVEEIEIITNKANGAIGIDSNVDGVAVVEVDPEGNLLHHKYQKQDYSSQTNKRLYEIRCWAKQLVDRALRLRKPIVLEDLKFSIKKKRSGSKKSKRKKHNFSSRARIQAVVSRARKIGVEVVLINPAFTSMLGEVKYQDLYSLSRHVAAALVIARRGLGIKERVSVTVKDSSRRRWNLEGRNQNLSLSQKQYSWLSTMVRQRKPAGFTAPELTPQHEENHEGDTTVGVAPSLGEILRGEPVPITGRYRQFNNCRTMKGVLVSFFQAN